MKTMNKSLISDQHLKWIDCLKFFSVFAVFTDHTYKLLYFNQVIWYSTIFSVSVFVFIGGFTAYRSNIRNLDVPWAKNISRQLKRLLIPYAIATACYLFYEQHVIDLRVYLRYLVEFNKENIFYFIVFYLQLALISRLLTRAVAASARCKHKIPLFLVELAAAFLLSSFFICHTFILPVDGGGKFLFGGTYFFLYYAGMIYSKLYESFRPQFWLRCVLCMMYLAGMALCVRFISVNEFVFDTNLKYFGSKNPPGPSIIIYAFTVIGFVRSLDEILDRINSKILDSVRSVIGKLGQKSYYIFLFHILSIAVLQYSSLLSADMNIWLLRIIYVLFTIASGCAMGYIIEKMMSTVRRLSRERIST